MEGRGISVLGVHLEYQMPLYLKARGRPSRRRYTSRQAIFVSSSSFSALWSGGERVDIGTCFEGGFEAREGERIHAGMGVVGAGTGEI